MVLILCLVDRLVASAFLIRSYFHRNHNDDNNLTVKFPLKVRDGRGIAYHIKIFLNGNLAHS
jgi:hypothetical protein